MSTEHSEAACAPHEFACQYLQIMFCKARTAMRSALPRGLVAVSIDTCTERRLSPLSLALRSWLSCFVGPMSSHSGETWAPKDSLEASLARRPAQRLLTEACSEAVLPFGLL